MKEITVDTNVVVFAIRKGDPGACHFLYGTMSANRFVLDHECEIDEEYRRQLGEDRRFQKWWIDVSRRADRHIRYTNKPCAEDKREFKRVGFSRKDWKFAGVCIRSADKILVTEDTNHFERVQDYLEKKRGMTVKGIRQALNQHEEG